MREEVFKARDGKEIILSVWDEVDNPKGVVQIVHGMSEHMERYNDFALYLNANGYIAAGDDHRAHGKTAKGRLGADDGDIAQNTVQDEKGITAMLSERYKLPIVIIGHSYGSFIMQEYILQGTDKIKGVVLSGSAHQGGLISKLGLFLAKNKCKKHEHEGGKIFAGMTFEAYDKKLGEGKNAWLTRDKSIVEYYNNHEFCGHLCSHGFYKSMLTMFSGLYRKERLAKIDKDLKMFIASGGRDFVGGQGKLVIKLANMYIKNGLKDVNFKLYEDARHEILNEINKEEVYKDMLDFVEYCIEDKEKSEE